MFLENKSAEIEMLGVKTARITLFWVLMAGIFTGSYCQNTHATFDQAYSLAKSFENINPDSVILEAKKAFEIALKQKQPDLQIDALILQIRAQSAVGKHAKAIKLCLKADSIARAFNLTERKIEILMYRGVVYQNSGFSAEGLQLLYRALHLIETSTNTQLQAAIDYYLGLVHYYLNENKKCRTFLYKAIDLELKRENYSGLINNYLLIANTFNDQDSVQKYLELANKYLEDREMDYKMTVLLNNKALLFKSQGKYTHAKNAYIKAIEIAKANSYKSHLTGIYNNLAYLLMAENKTDSAVIVLDQALALARELKNIDLEASVMDSYSDLFTSKGDSVAAFRYYKQSVRLRNEYQKQQQIEQSLFLSTVFETEKKEREIALKDKKLYQVNTILFAALALLSIAVTILIYLRQKAAARKARIKNFEQEKKLDVANALIEGQDAERKRLAMDLHDGISPKIGSLKMSMQNEFKDLENVTAVIRNIDEIGNDIRDLSHRMLPARLESEGLVRSLNYLIQLFERSNRFRYTFYANFAHRLDPRLETNLYYLSYELINNAVKHSEGSEINVQLLADAETLSLSVEDDGKGFDTSENAEGLGLKNIRQRVSFFEGNLTIDSEKDRGTAIIIELKL